jgi:hypothetical protein
VVEKQVVHLPEGILCGRRPFALMSLAARDETLDGQNRFVGKILEIHQEFPGRIHVVPIRESVGF